MREKVHSCGIIEGQEIARKAAGQNEEKVSLDTRSYFTSVKDLLSNLNVVCALLLGFTITMSSSFKHDELVAADARYDLSCRKTCTYMSTC